MARMNVLKNKRLKRLIITVVVEVLGGGTQALFHRRKILYAELQQTSSENKIGSLWLLAWPAFWREVVELWRYIIGAE